ncbi:MAG: hypothetical protein AMXMBFR84_01840 [Candidatus Hydrogenedentota bacterium]
MRTLLRLQELDLKIEACKLREDEIPKQKNKFDVQKKRLAGELQERENRIKALQLEQRQCEGEISEKQAQIGKYQTQLLNVKKNDEYQALLHEIDAVRKQIAQREERIIQIMMELDEARAMLAEDKKRIDGELKAIAAQCTEIDQELAEAVKARESLELQRKPFLDKVEATLFSRYQRIRQSKKTGAAAVPLNDEVCSGCNMRVTAQIVNEILEGKIHNCRQCGRLLYSKDKLDEPEAGLQSA